MRVLEASQERTNGGPVLECRQLAKRYGAVVAVRPIDLELRRGEVVGLIGDNGAGKSTLVKMLSGAVRPESGQILHRGELTEFTSPMDARHRGIETVYQDLALASVLNIPGNLYLGREIRYWAPLRGLSLLNRRAMARGAIQRLEELGINLRPELYKCPVSELSGGQRQAVAVARAAAWATDVLFMDEPTAALGVKQTEAVLSLARRLADKGTAVVLITHTLSHVLDFADRVVVLRHGAMVADLPHAEATAESLISLMVGSLPTGVHVQEQPLHT